jgi:hypothetical protein
LDLLRIVKKQSRTKNIADSNDSFTAFFSKYQ